MFFITKDSLFPNLASLISKRILGIDYGRVRIGISVGQFITRTATPVTVLTARKGLLNWYLFDWIIKYWFPSDIVIGLAKSIYDQETFSTKLTRSFAIQVKKRYRKPVYLVDEFLSTHFSHLILTKVKHKAVEDGLVDDCSACLILETWMYSH
jgi:putative Holliday junction resolvase